MYLPAQCRSINSHTPTVYICFSGSRMYLPASNGNLCILFIYVSVGVECICQPSVVVLTHILQLFIYVSVGVECICQLLMGTCVYCLYMFQWE